MKATDTTGRGKPRTVAEAARALGISPDAVRARCRRSLAGRGSLDVEQGPDGRFTIYLPESTSTHESVLVAHLQAENEWLRSLVQHLTSQNADLQQRLLPPPAGSSTARRSAWGRVRDALGGTGASTTRQEPR